MTDQISSGYKIEIDCYTVSTCVYIISHCLHISGFPCELLTPTHCCLSVYTGVSSNYFVYTARTSSFVKDQYATVSAVDNFLDKWGPNTETIMKKGVDHEGGGYVEK